MTGVEKLRAEKELLDRIIDGYARRVAEDFDHVAELVRRGDREGLLQFMREHRED